MTQDNIGIDISKDKFDAHRLSDGAYQEFPNTKTGFRQFQKWLGGAMPARVVYEATGAYHGAFERALGARLPLVKVNPLQARRFAQARGQRAKTDKVDARMLAQMGVALSLEPDAPKAQDFHILKELQVARGGLIKDRTRVKNQIHQQSQPLTRQLSQERLEQIEAQIKELDAAIQAQIAQDETRARKLEILQSIPGIGSVVAATILTFCPEIGTLRNKATASLAGLAPFSQQSGNWRGKAHISGGRKPLRDALYMPALVATRFNPDLKAQYERLRERGKPAKIALTAIMRKLIILANTLIKDDRLWVNNQVKKHA